MAEYTLEVAMPVEAPKSVAVRKIARRCRTASIFKHRESTNEVHVAVLLRTNGIGSLRASLYAVELSLSIGMQS